ncbi:MFS transporter [Shewanella sp. SW32]|uniref:MFS transporter n=1 Tax=Shewanella TaxID=22 RepID=UPI0021D8E97D|nr:MULTISPECIES: MFS transporter [unclassified Shewanella]MCU7962771.1 MFS transporter [Shewanella sp. SW32]MCU7970667.1 MFS transporter [Shewanella sp. SW29]
MTTQVCETLEPCCAIQQASQQQTANWSGVLAMSLCVFVLVASEFMPVSLLTPIAADLNVSEGLVGQGIAISGFFAVLTSLSIASIAKDTDRRSLLLGLISLMLVSGIVIAYAPNYLIYMLGRSLIGVVIGGFWSLSGASAIRLVPTEKIPKALAIFNGGNALAMVIAAPLGSYLGAHIGWRGAFFGLVPVALIAFVFSLLNKPLVRLGMLAIVLFFMGQFALFTYVRPFLETAIHVESNNLSFILLVMGVAGFMGTLLVSVFLKNNLYRTLIFIPLVMAVIALALILFSDSSVAVTTLLALWGGVATSAPVAWWTWLARTMPDDSEVAGGLMVAVIQLAIGLGSTLGGVLFDFNGYHSTFLLSATLLAAAALLAYWTKRSTPKLLLHTQ